MVAQKSPDNMLSEHCPGTNPVKHRQDAVARLWLIFELEGEARKCLIQSLQRLISSSGDTGFHNLWERLGKCLPKVSNYLVLWNVFSKGSLQ